MPDSRSFREVASSVTVSYPFPFIFASLLAFALPCFGLAAATSGALQWLLAGTGVGSAVVAVTFAVYVALRRPELLRSERYTLMHRALDILGDKDMSESARNAVSSTVTGLLAGNETHKPRSSSNVAPPKGELDG